MGSLTEDFVETSSEGEGEGSDYFQYCITGKKTLKEKVKTTNLAQCTGMG